MRRRRVTPGPRCKNWPTCTQPVGRSSPLIGASAGARLRALRCLPVGLAGLHLWFVQTATENLKTALAHRHRIERELGEGGMTTVYLAHDLKHDRKVALKVLKPDIAQTLGGERFLREIAIRDPQFVIFSLGWPVIDALRAMPVHRAMLKEIKFPGVMND